LKDGIKEIVRDAQVDASVTLGVIVKWCAVGEILAAWWICLKTANRSCQILHPLKGDILLRRQT